MITKEEILKDFESGIDCGQIVLREVSNKLGIDEKLALRIASPFGGGSFKGETCGCLEGAYIALGIQYGHDGPNQEDEKAELIKKIAIFDEKFKENVSNTRTCEEMLGGLNFGNEEDVEKIMEKDLIQTVCAGAVRNTLELLEELL